MGYESGRLPTRLDIGPPLPQAPGAPRGYDIMLTAKRLVVCLAAAAIAQSGCVTAADRLGKLRGQPLFSTSSASTTVSPAASRCTVPNGINAGDADEVADAVADTLACHDTRSDDSPLDATRRAAQWLDPALVRRAQARESADATWVDWKKRGVWMSVVMGRVEPDRTPDYDSGVVTLVRQTEVIPGDARDKLAGPTMTIRWTFTLTKRGNRWMVTTIDKQQWQAESGATP